MIPTQSSSSTESLKNPLIRNVTNSSILFIPENFKYALNCLVYVARSSRIQLRPRENTFGTCRHVVASIGQSAPTPNNYILNATRTVDHENLPTLSNGNLAFTVYSDTLYLNGVFSGVGNETQRARIPNYGRVQFEYCGPFTVGAENCEFSFDLRRGLFRTGSQFRGNAFAVELLTFPHRQYEKTIVNQLKITRQALDRSPFLVRLFSSPGSNSADFNLTRQQFGTVEDVNYMLYELNTISSETADLSEKMVFVLDQDVPEAVTLAEGQNELIVTWFTTISEDIFEALNEFTAAVRQRGDIVNQHIGEWERFWAASGITVEGNGDLAQTIHSSLYALASALPSLAPRRRVNETHFGLSPDGLGNDHYQGRSLWDSEIWLLPPALLLEPKWSESLLEYRFDRRSAAEKNAVDRGFVGFLYPTESATSGNEVSSDRNAANLKHHVSGDVAFAVKQHLFATADTEWFERVGCELAIETAKFWENRTVFNSETRRYDINSK